MSELIKIDAWLAALAAQLSPAERKKLTRQWASELRKRQRQQISQQRNPDGTPYTPRKPQEAKGRKKIGRVRRKMFSKLQTTRFMKVASSQNDAVVFFAGPVQRIARVHHYGLRERIYQRGKRGPQVKYDARELLGLNDGAIASIGDILIDHLSK
ncbi:phage virion morphogenesis protein [Gibbsiella quercinecans]|nr:phage virion morphogenesis protein [Gibbsiella quercinecans]